MDVNIFPSFARRVSLAVTIGGHDATSWLLPSLLDFEYTDNASGKADEIQITLHDREGLWNGEWKPAKGTEVTAAITVLDWFAPGQHAELPFGSFKIDEIEFSGPPDKVKIKAVSASLTGEIKDAPRTRAWENHSLRGVARDIAAREGLTLMYTGPEHSFQRRDQREESDLSFLHRASGELGMDVKVHGGKLIVFDSEGADDAAPVLVIRKSGEYAPGYTEPDRANAVYAGDDSGSTTAKPLPTVLASSWRFRLKSADTDYSACEIAYNDPQSGEVRAATASTKASGSKTLRINARAESSAQAAQMAKSALRDKKEKELEASLELMGHPGLVAGMTVELAGFGQFSGKWFVTKSTHKVGGSGGYFTSAEVRGAISKDAIKTAALSSVSVAPEATASGENAYARWEAAFNKTYNDLYKSGNLTPKDELLLCLPAIAEAEARRADGADRQGWLYLKAMFHKWFSGPANANAGSNAEPFWIDWDWVMSFPRAREAYQQFIDPVYMYHTFKPYIMNDAARKSLGTILKRNGLLSAQNLNFNFTITPWQDWQDKYHTQTSVERGATADGLMAAMGAFNLRALAGGSTNPNASSHSITVNKASVFARDRFNFDGDDYLHYWDCAGKKFDYGMSTGEKLTNLDFNEFRKKYNIGNDFLVLSRPHQVEKFAGTSYVYP